MTTNEVTPDGISSGSPAEYCEFTETFLKPGVFLFKSRGSMTSRRVTCEVVVDKKPPVVGEIQLSPCNGGVITDGIPFHAITDIYFLI